MYYAAGENQNKKKGDGVLKQTTRDTAHSHTSEGDREENTATRDWVAAVGPQHLTNDKEKH